jgi:hypothetical protein
MAMSGPTGVLIYSVFQRKFVILIGFLYSSRMFFDRICGKYHLGRMSFESISAL